MIIYLSSLAICLWTPLSAIPLAAGVLLSVATVLVFVLAPQDHPNRPVEGGERVKFRRRSRIIVVVECVAIAATLLLFSSPVVIRWAWFATLAVAAGGLSLLRSNWKPEHLQPEQLES